MKYVIGIDGGGTSTVASIVSSEGKLIKTVKAGPSNPNTTSTNQLKETFQNIYIALKEGLPTEVWKNIIHLFAGISGAEHEQSKQIIYDHIQSIFPDDMQRTVDNDAITALYAGTMGSPGIVQICGTGSISFGVNQAGKRDRVGGWGHLIREKSSGYFLGKQALEAAFMSYDKLGKDTLLVEKIVRHFQVETLPKLVYLIYHASNSKEKIASIAPLVFEAAKENDEVAKQIIEAFATHTSSEVIALSERLFTAEERRQGIELVLIGSVFKQLNVFKKMIKKISDEHQTKLNFVQAKYEPVIGAVVAAFLAEGYDPQKILNENVIKE
ncbi:MAG TPA: BadF/BadG/BcrA/BcrD ATPase family protein [Pseudogracilibacillus sp.]|nr:BadF/BadG/BcrA/BcrD ATPase family protein [Pseudogracilibacillus sp.]